MATDMNHTVRLTPRQLEVLKLVAAGNSTAAIADQLGVGEVTVKTHLTAIYRRVGARNRVQATRYYLDHLAPPQQGGT